MEPGRPVSPRGPVVKPLAPGATRAVFRSADDLFSQLALRDVSRVLDKTKLDAEKKRAELRELVGRRYHDLIESADAIAGMNETVAHFEAMLSQIEAKAEQLLAMRPLPADDISSAAATTAATSAPAAMSSGATGSDGRAEDILERASAEVLAALDRGQEIEAARMYLEATRAGESLKEPPALASLVEPLPANRVVEIRQAAAVLGLDEGAVANIIRVTEKAQAEVKRRALLESTVWARIPTLEAQWRLVRDSRAVILAAARQVLEDKALSTERYKSALGAIALLVDKADTLVVYLDTRALWVSRCAPDDLLAVVECAVRTARDAQDVVGRPCAPQVAAWMDAVVAPRSRESALLKRSANVSALAKLKRSLLDIEHEGPGLPREFDGLVDRLLGPAFAKRADELLEQSYRAAVKRAVKKLAADSTKPVATVVHGAVKKLEKALSSIEADAAALARTSPQAGLSAARELIAWLATSANAPLVCRACQAVAASEPVQRHLDAAARARLAQLNADARAQWVSAACQRHADRLAESYAKALPASGLMNDAASGDLLPSLPSWPVAEFCFDVAREIDAAGSTLLAAFEKADDEFATAFADSAWRSAFKTLAEAQAGADAQRKLQAAFDVDFCTFALLDGTAPLAFPSGIDVRATAAVLRQRARDYASTCVFLHRKGGQATAAIATAPALTLAEPVARFALLPVPQRQRAASPRTDKRPAVAPRPTAAVSRPFLGGWLG